MTEKEKIQTTLQKAEEKRKPLLTIRYDGLKVAISLFVMAFPTFFLGYLFFFMIAEGKILKALLFLPGVIFIILIYIDTIFFSSIEFYKDRVVKNWHWGGMRSIPYENARLSGPPTTFRWLTNAYHIRELKENGSVAWSRLPIIYNEFFVRSVDIKKVRKILDYLTGQSTDNPRMFKINELKEDKTWQS